MGKRYIKQSIIKYKRLGIALLISHNIDFRTRNIIKEIKTDLSC